MFLKWADCFSIVGPKSIILQWEQEIKQMIHASVGLKVIVYHGSDRGRKFREDCLVFFIKLSWLTLVHVKHYHSYRKRIL